MYQMQETIPFTRTGADRLLRLPDAVGMMMDCCQFQEYQEQDFCSFLRRNNIAVFLFSIQLDILRMPRFRETVQTAVKIYGCKSIYGLRRITMRDENQDLCIIANATGAFFDLNAGRAVKVDPEDLGVRFDEAEPMECLPRKIPVPRENGIAMPPFIVGSSVLDYNGHLTSAAYFSVSSDVLPESFSYDRVRMEYKKQAKKGEIIIPELFIENGTAVVDMKNAGKESLAVAEYSLSGISIPQTEKSETV